MTDEQPTRFRPSYAPCAACARGDHRNHTDSFMQWDVWTWCNCEECKPKEAK